MVETPESPAASHVTSGSDIEVISIRTCKRVTVDSEDEIEEVPRPSTSEQPLQKRQKTTAVSKGRFTHSHQTQTVRTEGKKTRQFEKTKLKNKRDKTPLKRRVALALPSSEKGSLKSSI
ncbi:hypothetical protein M422DRAFT_253145 [Sphaerobolus stellatus SS14]|uniref:Uncharacterized protein n=1 Tax=Sphaerobolus stellatus (strain SS14) TaxID=990650 RepID=A0A0C9VYL8_SPHS4|nr:hypothetical protein M422DRAFT_253145 [Sphaerobolus stellatus SS14]